VYLFPPVNGARRWIRVGPLGFQPSELAKLAFVLALARYLSYRESCRRLAGLIAPVALTLVPVVLVLKEPDLGSALVFLPVLGVMLLAAGARPAHLAAAAMVAFAVAPLLWHEMSREQRSRITALVAQVEAPRQPSDDDYHLYQAKQLMALGGWTGSWLSQTPVADVRARLVPESHTDSVVSVLGERTGLVGVSVVLLLFLALIARLLRIAASSREPFGRLLAVGVATLLGVQATINAGMMVGLLPITGLTLPLVSYGGSSLLVTGASLGLAMSVAVHADYEVGPEPFVYDA
jgi:cell division protein FtsW (lipid II flippase)